MLESNIESSDAEDTSTVHYRRRRLKILCPTRWVDRHNAIAIFVELLPYVVITLDQLAREGDAKTSASASSLLLTLRTPQFLIALFIANSMLLHTLPLSKGLQDPAINLGDAFDRIKGVQQRFQALRNDAEVTFASIFAEVQNLAAKFDIHIEMPRRAGRQVHRVNVPADTPEVYYRRSVFIPFCDNLIEQLQQRFPDPPVLVFTQELLPGHAREGTLDRAMEVVKQYAIDLPGSEIEVKAEISDWIHEFGSSGNQSLPEAITCAKRLMYHNVEKMFRLYATLPTTTATAERSFSQLRRLKNYLRSTMGTERLTGLAMMAIHRDINIDIDQVIDRFRDAKSRRLTL